MTGHRYSGGNNSNKNGRESRRYSDIFVVNNAVVGNAGGGNDSMPASTPNIATCMDCNLIPTNHTCLKCKNFMLR